MIPIVLGAAFAAACLFVAVFALLSGPKIAGGGEVLDRLEEKYMGAAAAPVAAPRSSIQRVVREALQARLGNRLDRSDRGSALSKRLMFADLRLKPIEWVSIGAGVSVFGGLIAVARFNAILAAPVGMLVGYLGCEVFLRVRIGRRVKKFETALGPMIMAVANGVKAGYTFAQALDLVSKTAPPPMDLELVRVARETQLGVPMAEALRHMVVRNENEDLKLLLTAVQLHTQVGGNLAEILDSIASTIRERDTIRGDVKTITAQARASGWVLLILPFALAAILQVIAPSYFGPMLTDPLGLGMLGLALFSLSCGFAVIQKIIKIEV